MFMRKHKSLRSLIGGFAAGLVNGMLGAGGGMLAVPFLCSAGLSRKDAHANSVAVIMPLSLFSAVLYLAAGSVSTADVLPYLPWGILGGVAGAVLLGKVPDKWLKRIFACFIIWAGFRFLTK